MERGTRVLPQPKVGFGCIGKTHLLRRWGGVGWGVGCTTPRKRPPPRPPRRPKGGCPATASWATGSKGTQRNFLCMAAYATSLLFPLDTLITPPQFGDPPRTGEVIQPFQASPTRPGGDGAISEKGNGRLGNLSPHDPCCICGPVMSRHVALVAGAPLGGSGVMWGVSFGYPPPPSKNVASPSAPCPRTRCKSRVG